VPSFRGMNVLTPQVFGDGVFTSTYGGTTQLFNISAAGATSAWSIKYEGNMSSPVVVDGHAYFLGKDQRAVSFDLKTGKQNWRSEKSYGKYWNLIASGDKILALDSRGTVFLLKANPKEFEILAEAKVADGETWAHIALCDDILFVRDLNGLAAWRWSANKE
jgi:outer membrane protein assembly factor BamB